MRQKVMKLLQNLKKIHIDAAKICLGTSKPSGRNIGNIETSKQANNSKAWFTQYLPKKLVRKKYHISKIDYLENVKKGLTRNTKKKMKNHTKT